VSVLGFQLFAHTSTFSVFSLSPDPSPPAVQIRKTFTHSSKKRTHHRKSPKAVLTDDDEEEDQLQSPHSRPWTPQDERLPVAFDKCVGSHLNKSKSISANIQNGNKSERFELLR
jgi:hypothetical protein